MNIQKRWKAYCSGDPHTATEDDWNNFIQTIFSKWQDKQMKADKAAPSSVGNARLTYAHEHYRFEIFVATSEEFQELCAIEATRQRR